MGTSKKKRTVQDKNIKHDSFVEFVRHLMTIDAVNHWASSLGMAIITETPVWAIFYYVSLGENLSTASTVLLTFASAWHILRVWALFGSYEDK